MHGETGLGWIVMNLHSAQRRSDFPGISFARLPTARSFSHAENYVAGDWPSRWMTFLRREVEALVRKKHGENYLNDRQVKTELAHINRELRRLKNTDCSVGRAEIKTDCPPPKSDGISRP